MVRMITFLWLPYFFDGRQHSLTNLMGKSKSSRGPWFSVSTPSLLPKLLSSEILFTQSSIHSRHENEIAISFFLLLDTEVLVVLPVFSSAILSLPLYLLNLSSTLSSFHHWDYQRLSLVGISSWCNPHHFTGQFRMSLPNLVTMIPLSVASPLLTRKKLLKTHSLCWRHY